jgi:hypothetical protein
MSDDVQSVDSFSAGSDGEEEEGLGNQDAKALQQLWLKRIKAEEKAHKDFRDRARDVDEVYHDDIGLDDELYVPLLWSVVEVEHAGIYSSQPVPDVRPANDEKNPAFRKASDVLERGIAHFVDKQAFDNNFHRCVDNFLVTGLGVPRIKMKSQIVDVPIKQPPPPPEIAAIMDDEDREAMQQASMQTEKGIGDQDIVWEYVAWDLFGWEPCNNWDHCDWIYYRHPMTQDAIKERFGRSVRASKTDAGKDDSNKTFDIYEVWDKKHRRQLFLAKNEAEPLEINTDPLGLAQFYPSPTPMMTNLCTDKLIPKADYDYIEPYDRELNRLQERRMALLEQIRAVGAHDAGMPELGDIIEQEDGQSLAIPNLAQRSQGGGFDAVMFNLPIEDKVVVLAELTNQIQLVKAQVDEIMGIADIVRGVSNAKEGVGTQELKGRWVGIRLSRKRDTVAYTVREMFRMMAQLLATHFTDENLVRLTQVEIDQETMQLLRNDTLMDFAIDIETESTVAKDEFRERETRQEMLGAVGQYSQAVLPMVQQGMLPADVSSAVLRAALQPYAKYSRALDESMGDLQTTMQQLQQMNGQIQQLTQERDQVTQERDQWQTVATQLQYQATEATAQQKIADAGKKTAEAAKIASETDGESLVPMQKAADIDNTRMDTKKKQAEAFAILNPEPKQVQ